MEYQLILKKLNNTLSQEERKQFDQWLSESKDHQLYFEKVKRAHNEAPETIDIEKAWLPIAAKINPKPKRYRILTRAVVAAAIAVLLSLPFYFNQQSKTTDLEGTPVTPAVIAVGTDKATLTLDDGSQVHLEEGGTYQNNTTRSNGKSLVYDAQETGEQEVVRFNRLSIPRGGQFQLVLSDGTKVWLNSDSELKYPIAFPSKGDRTVELVHGEAFFEVSPSTQHNGNHFKVITQSQTIDVLGTEFNIKAYKEDSFIETTLVHGAVAVTNGELHENLNPGHQSTWDAHNGKMTIAQVEVENIIAWKDGLFGFKNMPLRDIMTTLSRWYDIEVEFVNESAANITFNGVFNKKQDVQNILSIIESTNEAKFTTQGKTVRVE